ncbi:hypothetical protein BPAE_0162g00020 [Botrytis paeoniae]|uniref:Uncharacterized protein n=1 Tax=Botrytis paeoniae TaxID=278948 RepID=A0A4Z1FLN3_9HELO|nr:hypothetical protein BPAE_0162g00020 [Botrytis paeoniae]
MGAPFNRVPNNRGSSNRGSSDADVANEDSGNGNLPDVDIFDEVSASEGSIDGSSTGNNPTDRGPIYKEVAVEAPIHRGGIDEEPGNERSVN